MKKSLIALAVIGAFAGGASAQTSVTLYGAVDASFNHASGGGVSKNFLGSSQLGSSKLGFMGSEDLGSGLKANFKLEAGLNNDSGTGKGISTDNQAPVGSKTQGSDSGSFVVGTTKVAQTSNAGLVFNRFSYVGLSGAFGETRLGRDYVSTFLQVQAAVDPFSTNGPADSTQAMLALGVAIALQTVTNASNLISYTTPDFGGLKATGQIWFGENKSGTGTAKSGNGDSLSVSFAQGPITANVGTTTTKLGAYQGSTPLVTINDSDKYTLNSASGSFDFGVAKAVATIAREKVTIGGVASKNNTMQIGAIVPVGAINLKASYITGKYNLNAAATDSKGSLFGLGADYALSKRTTTYVTLGKASNKDGGTLYQTGGLSSAVANVGTTNIAVGLKANF